jgi:hypothetical protein
VRHLAAGLAVLAALLAFGAAATTDASSATSATDRCVRGLWQMPNERANTFLQNLIGNPAMRVKSGALTAGFNATEARYGSTHFVLQMDLGDAVLQASATFIFEATYRTAGGKIVLGRGQSELVISKFKAIKNGRTITVPGPPPSTRAIPAGATPYVCTRRTLRWRVPFPGPTGTWAAFDKVR